MRPTGKRSNTSPLVGLTLVWVTCGLVAPGAQPACALDVFTLWRQPELPLRMEEGAWADYRSQVMAGGVITVLPILILFLFFQRGIIRHIMRGAVKG